jgi:PPIC-type PPIASE domain
LVGLAVVAFAVWLVARNFEPPQAIGHDPAPHVVDAGPAAASLAVDAGEDTGTLFLGDLLAMPAARIDGGAGATLLDGVAVPPLPLNVPREVRFGVVLVSYAGAQVNTTAGPPPVRLRAEARSLAEKLAATAQQDFHAAVQQGDAGSTDDLGHVKLGILEPAPEYVLFTLPVDGVGGPVETPRGFWIVKRLE